MGEASGICKHWQGLARQKVDSLKGDSVMARNDGVKQRRRNLSVLHMRVLAFLVKKAEGADGKTAFVRVEDINDELGINDYQATYRSVRQLERWQNIEVLRNNGVTTGFRVLKLLPDMPVSSAKAERPGAGDMPEVDAIDNIMALIDLAADHAAGGGITIHMSSFTEQAIALRKWVRRKYGK